ncbi:MAG: hypothetical protein KF713_12025 [Turneriella sp.]|nr:hypothetical protein [Turneriella sp.]
MNELKIRGVKKDKGGFAHLSFTKPENYTFTPGQYAILTFTAGDKPKYLAFASHTTEADLLFVLRGDFSAGTEVAVSAPQGKGFGCDFGDTKPMLFLTHGTGISAIRPALIERKKRGFENDVLLYGIASAAQEPELDCLAADFGVEQLRAFSAAEYKAYVQDHAHTLAVEHFGAVLLVGSKEMMASCREVLAAKGFPAEKVFSNY